MKKKFDFWLMALLVGGLSMAVTSCKDDDDKDNGGGSGTTDEEFVLGPTDTDEAHAAYLWLANMTDMDEFTDDWASKTYEPTIGEPSQNQATTRVVCVADLDYAKMNFSSISGIDPDKLSTSQTQSIDSIGSLTWTPSASGAENLSVVDVNTKLIPHLSRIVYCTIEQAGDNGGSYAGTAYYRFGDVIEDPEGFYWVCVKPPFGTGTGAQQQGYWINILNRDPVNGKSTDGRVPPIPTINIYDDYNSKKKYNYNTILLPTKLKSTKENVHHLSNLIWALLDPNAYKTAVGSSSSAIGLGGYEYKYNGAKFAKRVADEWTKKHIWEKLFNRTYEQMKDMKKLNFYYDGKYWFSGSTGSVPKQTTSKYEKTFGTTFSQDKENNYVQLETAGSGYDMRRYCSDPEQDPKCASSGSANYAPAEQFSGTQGGHWIVRQKTSSQLAGTMSHPKVIVNLENTTVIYLYNISFTHGVGSTHTPETEDDIAAEIDPKDIAVGNILGQNGKFYTHAKYARQLGTTPIAIVAYVTGSNTSKLVEESTDFKDKKYNCLLMSLTRKANKVKWSESSYSDNCQVNVLTNFTDEPTGMEGLGNTTNLCNHCDKSHNHPAAEQCEKNTLPDDATNFSSWFLPSVAQFEMAVKTLGGFTWSTTNGFGAANQKDSKMAQLRKKFEAAGVETEFDALVRESPTYWTSTLINDKNSNRASCFLFQYFLNSGENLSSFAKGTQDEAYVLPFIAFRYEAKR